MSADDNIKTIMTMYEAFGRGDLQGILDLVTDDVDWSAEAATSGAPWYGVRKGKAAVTAFFEAFGSTMEVEEFTPYEFAATDDTVHSLVRCRTKTRGTGKVVDMTLHHYFRFTGDKVSFYRGSEDTAQVEAALA